MPTPERWWVFTLAHVTKRQHNNCGHLCPGLPPRCDTRSARHAFGISPTPTFGQLMQQCFQANGIRQWAKRRAKPVIWSDLITPYGNEFLAWCEKPCRFPNPWRIRSVLFGILYTSTIHHYLFSTTPNSLDYPSR